jgi:hypothetical protein
MRRFISYCVPGVLWVWLLASCSKPPAEVPASKLSSATNITASSEVAGDVSATPMPSDGPPAGEKICFACKGSGTVKCTAPGCVDGMVDCPGPCLKLDRGVWVHLDVPGHPSSDIWQQFYQSDGSYEAYNQGHLGHVIVMENGMAVDTGPCKICGGTGKVPCSVCKGTGQVVCPICEGKKYVPDSWTPTDNPWLDGQPDLIRLADGRILFGKVMSTVGSDVAIKTRDGRWLHFDVTNVVSSAGSTSATPVN